MDKILHQHVRLRCTTKEAFRMFTVNELLESWLTSSAEVEPFTGGKYELFWDPTKKENNSTIGCKVTAIEPNRFLSFEWKGPKQFESFMNEANPLTHVVVFFLQCTEEPLPCTDVHLIHSGWRRLEEWERARKWFEKAWSDAFENLRNQVNAHSKT